MRGKKQGNVSCHGWLVQASKGICKRNGAHRYLENCILKKIEVLQKCNIQTSRSTPAESWRSISKRSKKRQMHGACILVTLYQCAGKSQDWFTGEGS